MFGFGRGEETGGNGPPRLEPRHLFEKRAARDKARLKAYNQILSQIYTRIYHTSQLSGSTNYLVYTVPPFILGLPQIDLQDCIIYLVTILRQNKFNVRFTYPNLLYISWKHFEHEYNMQQNPIVQAMMPPAAATSKKGAGGKRGADPAAAVRTVAFAPPPGTPGAPGAAPPRSAMDYQPPDSFLQGVTRPAAAPIGNGVPLDKPKTTGDVLAELWNFT